MRTQINIGPDWEHAQRFEVDLPAIPRVGELLNIRGLGAKVFRVRDIAWTIDKPLVGPAAFEGVQLLVSP